MNVLPAVYLWLSAAGATAKTLEELQLKRSELNPTLNPTLITFPWTAKALGVTIPPAVLAHADEVIE